MREIGDPNAPDRALTVHGPVIRDVYAALRRLRLIVFACLAGLALGVGIMLSLFRGDQDRIERLERTSARIAYEACVDRNARANASGGALAKLVDASRRDGDRNAERIWREFVEVSRRAPLPPCDKPTDGGG